MSLSKKYDGLERSPPAVGFAGVAVWCVVARAVAVEVWP